MDKKKTEGMEEEEREGERARTKRTKETISRMYICVYAD